MTELESFREVLAVEMDAIRAFSDRLDESIEEVIERLLACRGRIAVIGMGKCGHVARKIAATFASTGTPSVFVHPAEALHGDLGFVDEDDVALVLSYSGETMEITELLPHLQRMGVRIIAMTGGKESTLAQYARHVLDMAVEREAAPIQMAPTASSTLMLAVGDALASVLMKKREFGKEDYAKLHPGGSLGQKLLCTVDELMRTGKDLPAVSEDVPLSEALVEVTSKRMGAVVAVDDTGVMTGILTDGDIRRIFQRDRQPLDLPLRSVMTRLPKHIRAGELAVNALHHMEENRIAMLPVVDPQMRALGMIHIHDLVRAGIG